MLDLGEIREKIDGIDKQLVSLFEERMALCHSVAEYKISTGKKVLDTERENAKLAAITKMVQNRKMSMQSMIYFHRLWQIPEKCSTVY